MPSASRNALHGGLSSAAAPSGPSRRPFGRFVAALTGSALVATAAYGGAPVAAAATPKTATISPGAVDQAWWVADALLENRGATLAPFTYFQQLLQTMYRDDPGLAPATATAQVHTLQQAVQQAAATTLAGRHGAEAVPGLLALVQKAASARGIAPSVVEAVRVTGQYFESTAPDGGSAADQVTGSLDLNPQSGAVTAAATSVLRSTVAMAKAPLNANYRTAENSLFAASTAPTGAHARQIIAGNPDLAAIGAVNALIGTTGSVSTSVPALTDLFAATLDTVRAQQTEAQQTLAQIDAEQSDVVAYAKDGSRDAEKAADAKKADKEQSVIDQGKSAVSVLSTLIGIIDPKAGKVVEKVGSAVIEIASAVSKIAETASQLGGVVNALGSFAGAVATGNIISAVFSIVSLFGGGGGPDVNQQILQEIDKLRQQVADLGKKMDKRFDRVDSALNTIYSSMMQQFALIDTKLDVINGNVLDVLDRLSSLQSRLANLEGGLWSSLRDGFRRPLWDEIDSALGYSARTGTPLPPAQFLAADSKFSTWGTRDAYDAAATGPTDRSGDETTLADELNAYPLDANIGYLAQLPTQWGLPALTASPLPNPHDWFLASRAYIALVQDYPSLAQQNHALAQEVAGLQVGGARLQAFERAITAGAPDAHGLNPLFATLIGRYDAATADLRTGIARAEQPVRDNLGLDPFAGVGQSLSRANAFGTLTCGAHALDPATAARLVTNTMQIAQQYAKAGSLSICADGQWTNFSVRATGKREIERADLEATVTASWKGADNVTHAVRSQTVNLGSYTLCSTDVTLPDPPPCDEPSAETEMYADWAEAESALAADTAVQVDTTEQQVIDAIADRYLADGRTAVLTAVRTAFTTEPIHSAAARMTGIVAAIRSYVLAGMPNSYAGDELLSALLSGSQRVLDEDGEQRLVAAYSTAAGTPATDPTAALFQTIATRRDALAGALAADLATIRGGAVDGSPATATTMDRLATLVATVTSPAARFTLGRTDVTLPVTKVGRVRTVSYRVQNPGLGRLKVSSATVTGVGMRVVGQTCGSVAGHRTCTVTVRFAPTRPVSTTGVLRLAVNTPRKAITLRVHAVGRR